MTDDSSTQADRAAKPPFKALTFSFNDRAHGRMVVRMKHLDNEAREQAAEAVRGADYQLHVEAGPAERTTTDFTRGATMEQARRLSERLLDAGVFSWEETYGNDPEAGMARWMLGVVFEPGVFEIRSSGGSAYPAGFDAMMEALYELGLPQPGSDEPKRGGFGGVPFGEAAASGLPFNTQSMEGFAKAFESLDMDFGSMDMADLQGAIADMRANPQRMQELLRSEFRSMPADQQDVMLDLLASTGFATCPTTWTRRPCCARTASSTARTRYAWCTGTISTTWSHITIATRRS